MSNMLSPEFLQWPLFSDGFEGWGDSEASEAVTRPYKIWRHASRLLEQGTAPEFRADIVTNLNRAVSLRLRNLSSRYKLKALPPRRKKFSIPQKLADYEIIRPVLLRQLIGIRNAVEHRDEQPPAKRRCAEFVEFTWYFLKSTDALTRHHCTGLISESSEQLGQESLWWLYIDNGPHEHWRPVLHGWIPRSMISSVRHDGWLTIENLEVNRKDQGRRVFIEGGEAVWVHRPDDICIKGKLSGPEEALGRLARQYFAASL